MQDIGWNPDLQRIEGYGIQQQMHSAHKDFSGYKRYFLQFSRLENHKQGRRGLIYSTPRLLDFFALPLTYKYRLSCNKATSVRIQNCI